MSDSCPTVRVADEKAPGGFVVINEADFDADPRELYVDPEDASLASLSVKALKALAVERGVDLGDAAKKDDIIAALELAAEADSSEPAA
jgi:hypothetical protein